MRFLLDVVVLLFWDLLCFVGVSCLYYFSLAVIDERPNPVDPFAFTHCPGGNASALDALSHKVKRNGPSSDCFKDPRPR